MYRDKSNRDNRNHLFGKKDGSEKNMYSCHPESGSGAPLFFGRANFNVCTEMLNQVLHERAVILSTI